ncbi:MAG: hydroxylamine reductase, partial [Desulfobacteraceae bacterium]
MFCYQCEQTAKGQGCTKIGVCGKQPDTAILQDLLIYTVKGLSQVAVTAAKAGISHSQINRYTCEAIFSTLTNVDFDPDRFVALIRQGIVYRDQLKSKIDTAHIPEGPATFMPEDDKGGMVSQGGSVGVMADENLDADIRSLR